MCGRYAITLPPEAIRAFFRYEEQPNFPPRYNIAPTQPVPIVILAREPSGEKKRRFLLARWGLLPSFVKDSQDFPLLFNARSETAADKPSFRAAMKRRRCLFIADAFYEWRRDTGGSKTRTGRPYLFRRADGAPMGLAGLFETWSGTDGSEIDTACILTTMANGTMAAIHDRMPAVLEASDFGAWLDSEEVDATAASRLLQPASDDVLEFYEIGPAVNRVANDYPEIQAPARGQTAPPRTRLI
jgi:putative SOS response-associated peptidase YedK